MFHNSTENYNSDLKAPLASYFRHFIHPMFHCSAIWFKKLPPPLADIKTNCGNSADMYACSAEQSVRIWLGMIAGSCFACMWKRIRPTDRRLLEGKFIFTTHFASVNQLVLLHIFPTVCRMMRASPHFCNTSPPQQSDRWKRWRRKYERTKRKAFLQMANGRK